MIQQFVEAWESHKHEVAAAFTTKEPENYAEIVRAVVEMLHKHVDYEKPDPEKVVEICSNDYQGVNAYVLQGAGYRDSKFWYVLVDYGSCSGCDSLCAAQIYDDAEDRVRDYMVLALHILQSIKEMES